MSQLLVDDIINRSQGSPGFSQGAVVTGVATATTFKGNLEGNATTSSGLSGTASVNTTGIITAASGNFSGNVSIGGTLTYEDVTNIDSVGLITARSGLQVTSGQALFNTNNNGSNAEPALIVSGRANAVTDSAIVHVKRGTAAASLSAGDALGEITFTALDGGPAAQLIAKTGPGYTGTSDCPGELQFRTTVDGGNAPTERMKITSNGGILLSNGILVEHCKIVTSSWSTTPAVGLDDGNVFLNTVNLGGTNNVINITSTNTLNVDLATGDMTSVTLITPVNSTSSYIQSINVDGSTPTISWVGGSAPSDGGGSGYDTYTFNIIKTANATFLAIANQVKGS